MIFTELPLRGAWLIEPEPIRDARGHFARLFCTREFAERGLCADLAQASESANTRRGITRGLHFQRAPHAEDKLVRCTRGRIFDVMVDLRADSPTRLRWCGTELSAANGRQYYVPKGFAHGFQVLEDDSVVSYLVTTAHVPGAEGGVRWDDPTLAIDWPLREGLLLSARDRALPGVEALSGHAAGALR